MIETNRNGVSDRRASSRRRNTDVMKTKFPVVTHDFMAAILATKKIPENQLNIPTKQLCLARVKLQQSLMSLDVAIRAWNPQVEGSPKNDGVYRTLCKVRENVANALIKYPLEIK